MKSVLVAIVVGALVIGVVPEARAQSNVYLRKSCTGQPVPCYDDMDDLLTWVWGTRQPSQSDPLLIDLGPGEFEPFSCPDSGTSTPNGFVTLRGSGPGITRIHSTFKAATLSSIINPDGAIESTNCTALNFESLTVSATSIGIVWNGGGTSRWSNVEVLAGGDGVYTSGWIDGPATSCEPSLHYWFGSTIRVSGGELANIGYYVNAPCSETWFYGGEIEAEMSSVTAFTPASSRAIQMNRGDIRVFGSALRSHPGSYLGAVTQGYSGVVVGLSSSPGAQAEFHMHGGIINANSIGTTVAVDAAALEVAGGSMAHTPDTAFIVTVGSAGGTATRASGSPNDVSSPFLWQAGEEPPPIQSVDGEDLFVETDCSAQGSCNGTDDEPHLMIYRASCGASPWFDVVTGACRIP